MKDKIESTEDYLEKILMLKEKNGAVRAIDLANFMSFSKASVSIALKKLKQSGYVFIDDSTNDIELTPIGLEKAAKVYERHKVISSLLMELGINQEIALQDACRIEHDISEETFDKIKERYYKYTKKCNIPHEK